MGNFSFDEEEFSGQTAEEAADQAIEGLADDGARGAEPVETEPEEIDLSDVDLRLATADYYRACLAEGFFDVATPAGYTVDREIRMFVRERLEVLLGIRDKPAVAETPEPQFSDEEVDALKLLAAKVMGKPGLLTSSPPAPVPVAKRVSPPPARPIPVLRPRTTAKIPAPPPAPSTKPKTKMKAKPPAAKPPVPAAKPQEQKAAPKAQKPQKKSLGETQVFIDAKTGKEKALTEGDIIEENGAKFIVARNDQGTLFRKTLASQVVNPDRLPPMSDRQLEAATAAQAQRQADSLNDAVIASVSNRK